MPARGAGLAILKWVTSFPGNPAAGLPVVMGVICVSSAVDGEPLALVDVRSVTALRTGAVAAVAAQELAREDAGTVGIVGCGLHGAWAARCLAAAEYGPGLLYDPDPDAAGRLSGELGWEVGALDEVLGCDIVTCVTPGAEPVVRARDLRPGMHLSMLGADGPGKAEAEPEAVARAQLFCDEWTQASHGGELTGAVERRARGPRGRCRAGRRTDGRGPGTGYPGGDHPLRLDWPRNPRPRTLPRPAGAPSCRPGQGRQRDPLEEHMRTSHSDSHRRHARHAAAGRVRQRRGRLERHLAGSGRSAHVRRGDPRARGRAEGGDRRDRLQVPRRGRRRASA